MLLSSLLFTIFLAIFYIAIYISYKDFNLPLKKIYLSLLTILILSFNVLLVFYFYSNLSYYFIQFLPVGSFWITVLFVSFLWWISFICMICFPHNYIYIRTIVGTVHHCLSFFFNGFTSNVFRFIDDNIKTILNNSGGSPKLIWSWSDLPLPRFAQIQMGLVSLLFIELVYGNFLNQARYIPINSNESIRYTYGLVIMFILLFSFTLAFSRSGNRTKNLSSLFFTLGFFQSFLGEKIPGVLLKNIFSNLSTSSLVSFIAGSKDELDISAIMFGKNKEKQYKIIILPVHIFFLSVGRLLQVSLFIILNIISLLLFILFIVFCFGFIFNYINASEFGDGSISLLEVIKSLPHNSLNISLETLRSKLIVEMAEWAEQVSKFAEDPFSRQDLKNDLITKEEVPHAEPKAFVTVFFITFIMFSFCGGIANISAGVAA